MSLVPQCKYFSSSEVDIMGDDTHADVGLAGTGQEGTTPRNDNQGPTAAAAAVVVAPPPPAADDDAMEPPLSPEPPRWRFINEAKKLTLHRRSLLLPRSATTMWSPASGCRSLPPPLIILPPPRRVRGCIKAFPPIFSRVKKREAPSSTSRAPFTPVKVSRF